MANIKSAKKRVRTNEDSRARNAAIKSDLRTAVKVFNSKIEQKEVEGAKEAFVQASKRIDKAAAKGLIHRNAAGRRKSALQVRLNEITA
ncbi:30S ribosomal protein S20 [Paenalkalicoccus suaedae]|uniref:Small ribosomal subunit protein bS20 n=1 Tax=Paenalkalicoccus suaedae TaxID=2592382 RepID=A0A859FBW1_9BACI|nr:30S ribosomal protein S20 [Paenalkalicoccus suaedae]QKS70843.1 30S ribosomal protein S20 [Paenalkalicoccus suaedae]